MTSSKPQKVKCLFLLPSLIRAGAETQLVDLVNGLSNQDFGKHLFTFERNLDQAHRIDADRVKFHNIPRRYKFDFEPIAAIARLIDDLQIGVIHCTMQFSLLLAVLARVRSRRKPPILCALHSTYFHSLKSRAKDRLLYQHLLTRCCHAVIFVCQNQRDHWISKYPPLARHSHVIYNGIDLGHFVPAGMAGKGQELRTRLNISQDSPTIACIAGLRPEKGHRFLIDAFAAVPGTPHLILAGDGPIRNAIEQRIAELHLQQRVHLLGSIDDVRPVLATSDLLVLPSSAETFSMAMLESLAMEVPVIATDIGGAREAIISEETGFLVQPNDIPGLERILTQALSNRLQLREMGKRGRRLVLERFDRQSMIVQTGELLLAAARTGGNAQP